MKTAGPTCRDWRSDAGVTVELDGGQTVTATVTSSAADRLWLARGDEVDAVVQASSVMIDDGSEER